MTFVLYLDRVCIGQAAPAIQEELGISDTWMGCGLRAFTLSYALFEIPTGPVGRSLRLARGAHADRRLVVVLHGPDRSGDRA